MCAQNFCRLFGVFFYSILDLAAVLLIFIFFAETKESLFKEMFQFAYGVSIFDLILLGALRFSIINGLLLGVIFNHVHGTQRLRRWSFLTTYYGCLQAIYVVMKILIYTENHSCHVPKRFWSVIGITLFSCVMFHICWKTLSNYKKGTFTKLSVNAEDDENDTDNIEKTNETVDPGKMNTEDLKEAEKVSTSAIIKDLFSFAKPDILLVSVAFLLLVVASISEAIIPYYTGLVVNYIVIDKSIEKFHRALIYMALITILAGIAAGLRAGLFTYFGGRYSLRLQKVLFSKFMMMEIGFFDARKTGELTSRLTSDCTKVGDGMSYRINIFTRSIVKVIGILFFMIKLSWKLSTVSLVVVPIVAIISKYFGKKYEEVSEKVQSALAQANTSAEEALSSVRTVRSFAAENNEIERYSAFLKDTLNCFRQEGMIATGYRWSTEGTSFIMSLLILYYGGHLVMQNELAGGNLVSFILYSFDLTWSIQDIGDVFTGLMEIVGASKKVFLYINRQPKVGTDGQFKPRRGLDGHVEFKDVSFAYPTREDVTVLNNVSFSASKGEVVALVGPSGGGKSSVINLLQHFYEPQHGQILIDGVTVKDYNHDFLHEKMSLVQQEPILFARTISENIRYGLKSEVADFDVKYSAELANAHAFISAMPNEYNTQTGEKGVQLSGGQKQRIAIARALIRNPAILLLDEATSALDSESEHLVQQAINKNLVGRTVIVIAHRLSTVEKADKIIVIEKGGIVEVGRHQELMERQGAYAALVQKQLLGLTDAAVDQTNQTGNEQQISLPSKRTKSLSSSVRSNASFLSTSSSNM